MDSQETRIFIAVLITCILIGSVFIYFVVSIFRQQKRNLILQKQNSKAEITSMENERNRIATDLHDDIGPFLNLIKTSVQKLETNNEKEELKKYNIEANLDEAMQRIRNISFDLMPNALLRKGLVPAIKGFISFIEQNYPIQVGLYLKSEIILEDQKAIHIFRIVQEVVYNATRHAMATEIYIVLKAKDSILELKIADNGIGLDYNAELKETNGFGLRSIQNRTELMGGKMFVKTQKGTGLSYVFEIPVI